MSESTPELIGRMLAAPPETGAGPAPRTAASVQPLEALIGRMLSAPGAPVEGLRAEPVAVPPSGPLPAV